MLTLLAEKPQSNGQYPDQQKFVRNDGPYKIVDLIGTINPLTTGSTGSLNGRKAVIIGAGPAGLAASIVLNAKGYDVTVLEKRDNFSRFNVVNLNKEVQAFLREFNFLEEFEESVAARIQFHKIVVFEDNKAPNCISTTNVSKLEFESSLSSDPKTFKNLFQEDGIYSVRLRDLQAFLAQKAAKLGVKILSGSEIKFPNQIIEEQISEIEVIKKNTEPPLTLRPDLIFLADGTLSDSSRQLGMMDELGDVVKNVCSGEKWVYGNLGYSGDKTFVISMILSLKKTLQIANVIFNAKCKVINVAVTTNKENPDQEEINHLIKSIAKKALDYAEANETSENFEAINKPVEIINRKASICSKKNIFKIGDAAGCSSPLAGEGATRALSVVMVILNKLLEDYENGSNDLHNNFKINTQASVDGWLVKSEMVKEKIMSVYKNCQTVPIEPRIERSQ